MKTTFRRLAFALALIAGACSSLTDKSYAHDLPADRFVCPFVDSEWIDSPANCFATVPFAPAEIETNAISAKPNLIKNCIRNFGLNLDNMRRKAGTWWTISTQAISQFSQALPTWQHYTDPCELEQVAYSQSRVALPDEGLPPNPRSVWQGVIDVAQAEIATDDIGNPFVLVFEFSGHDPAAQLLVAPPADGCPPQALRYGGSDERTIRSEEIGPLQPCTPAGHYVSLANRTHDELECEEYRPYDLENHDSHWLSGIGQAWNWRKRLSAPISKYLPSTIPMDSSLHPTDCFNDRDPEFACEEEFAKALPTLATVDKSEAAQWTCPDEQFISSVQAVEEKSIEHASSDATAYLAMTCDLVENVTCVCQAECCDMQFMYAAGERLANAISQSNQQTRAWLDFVTSKILEFQPSQPTQFLLPMFAMVSTSDGATVIVPADLAQQWCADANAVSQDLPSARESLAHVIRDRSQRLIESTTQWIDWTIATAVYSVGQLCELHETLVANREIPSVR